MAEPSAALWQALVELDASPFGQPFMWRSARSDASLHRTLEGRISLDGAWSETDRKAFELLSPLLAGGRMAVAQLGQSLDGRIATESGDSYYINGQAMRTHLHRLRALVDAVLIGAGTALADRPALTVRHCSGSDPVPVIVDPVLRVPVAGPLFDVQRTPRLLLVHRDSVSAEKLPLHVESVPLPARAGRPEFDLCPVAILEALNERGLGRVLIEGGGVTVSRFIDADALDRLHLLIAPLLIGSGPSGIGLRPVERLKEARRPAFRSYPVGHELLVDVDMRSGR